MAKSRLIVSTVPLLLPIFLLAFRVSIAEAKVIQASSTIQAALDAANPGDTIVIPAGVHHESVLVKKNNLTLKGNPGAILDGKGLGNVSGIRVEADNSAEISGFKLIGTQIRNYNRDGIFLRSVDSFQITGVFSPTIPAMEYFRFYRATDLSSKMLFRALRIRGSMSGNQQMS